MSRPGGRNVKLSVKFYLTAILFVVFDVEAVFIYPWAIQFRSLGWAGISIMAGFLGTLVAGAGLLLEERSARMGDMSSGDETTRVLQGSEVGFATTQFDVAHRLGAEVLALQLPLQHGLLRHGVHVASRARASTSRGSAPRPRASRPARPISSGWSAPSASGKRPRSSASTSR